MKVILASKNQHKLTELSAILSQLGFEIALESEYGLDIDVEETGTTFEENSYLKAEAVMKASGLPVLADDSGLMVDALDGAPGVYSARYGHKASDKERTAYLLENMKDVPEERRGAKFVCVITCLFPDGRKIVARGECPGVIARAPHGENGFGYDPVFYLPELGMTYAELPSEQKNAISHRARALQDFCRKYQEVQNHDK
jgi:XTP/dITP diphosphohydrolase